MASTVATPSSPQAKPDAAPVPLTPGKKNQPSSETLSPRQKSEEYTLVIENVSHIFAQKLACWLTATVAPEETQEQLAGG
jgi:hypothetical protein